MLANERVGVPLEAPVVVVHVAVRVRLVLTSDTVTPLRASETVPREQDSDNRELLPHICRKISVSNACVNGFRGFCWLIFEFVLEDLVGSECMGRNKLFGKGL